MVLKLADGMPRRNRIDLHTVAETKIREALLAVEAMGADRRLTDAVVMLCGAGAKVADVVDERLSAGASAV